MHHQYNKASWPHQPFQELLVPTQTHPSCTSVPQRPLRFLLPFTKSACFNPSSPVNILGTKLSVVSRTPDSSDSFDCSLVLPVSVNVLCGSSST